MSSTVTSRRSVVRGAAWAAPVIAFGSAAPALAASGPTATIGVTGRFQSGANSTACPTGTQYTLDGTSTSAAARPGFQISNAASVTSYSVTLTFWLPSSGITFTETSGTAGWATLTATGASKSVTTPNGSLTLYAYQTSYTGPPPVANASGNIVVPFKFVSSCASTVVTQTNAYFELDKNAVVNGVAQTFSSAPTAMVNG